MKEQNIVTKIISDAENKAAETVAEAERRAEAIIEDARTSAAKER